jgi:hypothetical protein
MVSSMPDPNQPQSPHVLSTEEMERLIKLEGIFMPISRRQRDAFYARDPATGVLADAASFVHYTSAEAALSIIRNKRIWMRNAMSMADYREVQHGLDIFDRFFSDKSKLDAFVAAVDECAPGAAMEAIALFRQQSNTTRLLTYIASISEHLPKENQHGRLSMWRAFGGNTARVALVLKIPWYSGGAAILKILFSPVAYLQEEEIHQTIYKVIANVKENREFLSSLSHQTIVSNVFSMILAGVTCTKHEGFSEEREWRAIYSPSRSSDLMKCSMEVVGGIPQTVYSLPLDESISPALSGLEFSRIFDRLIIGPSQYPWPMYEAFTTALTQAGIPAETAQQRVRISGIPIRA